MKVEIIYQSDNNYTYASWVFDGVPYSRFALPTHLFKILREAEDIIFTEVPSTEIWTNP